MSKNDATSDTDRVLVAKVHFQSYRTVPDHCGSDISQALLERYGRGTFERKVGIECSLLLHPAEWSLLEKAIHADDLQLWLTTPPKPAEAPAAPAEPERPPTDDEILGQCARNILEEMARFNMATTALNRLHKTYNFSGSAMEYFREVRAALLELEPKLSQIAEIKREED